MQSKKSEQTLAELLESSCKKNAKSIAFSNFNSNITYQEFYQYSLMFAAYLQQQKNLNPGDRIGIMLPNLIQYPIVLFGILLAKLVVVNINPLYTSHELQKILENSKAKCIVVLENFTEVVANALPNSLENIIVSKPGDMLNIAERHVVNFVNKFVKKSFLSKKIKNFTYFTETLKISNLNVYKKLNVLPDTLAFLQYTSGTTGANKAVMLTNYNIMSNMQQIEQVLGNSEIYNTKHTFITSLPLYHIFSLTANLITGLQVGCHNILITNPKDINAFIKTMKKYKFTYITGVNTLFNALLDNIEFQKLNFDYLKLSLGGGTSVHQSVADKWHKITNNPILVAYGLTEASPAVSIPDLNNKIFDHSVGKPLPQTQIIIKDTKTNKNLPMNTLGVIWVKGPQIMKGYWKMPEETSLIVQDGWLNTGDIGYLNDEGNLFIVDRVKDLIITSGFNVYPNEVEEIIASHPKIIECCVVGRLTELNNEIVHAAIVLKKNQKCDLEEIKNYCSQYLTRYKIPQEISILDSIPKNNIGKILRKSIRDSINKKDSNIDQKTN